MSFAISIIPVLHRNKLDPEWLNIISKQYNDMLRLKPGGFYNHILFKTSQITNANFMNQVGKHNIREGKKMNEKHHCIDHLICQRNQMPAFFY